MHIQHLFSSWRSCNSQPRQLALLGNGALLMSFEDGCVRLCDTDTALDTMATLPQLSCACDWLMLCRYHLRI